MTDYGHDLLFGSFITPVAQDPAGVVALAQLSERVGLDLATFQDHPYQSDFLDAWTLMSYVAAATSRLRLSPNVLNLPLRTPVVLARSAASLDILSDGRLELGIGAGFYWDAIEAMAGPRRTPGESIEALDEAITIIRETWATSPAGGVRVDGQHYRVAGTMRGPVPRHDIAVWVGGKRPRMLRLIGRVADGWLPSLHGLKGGLVELARGNKVIDEAALEAGRNPQAVRRLLNIMTPPAGSDGWAEELAALALQFGISTFILMEDDPAVIQLFGEEIVPAVRNLVDRERGTSPSPVGFSGPLDLRPTPTPETRRSNRKVWDESTRPTAPKPPAGYVYAPRAEQIGQHLVDVHGNLRRELEKIHATIAQVRVGTLSVAEARSVLNETAVRQANWELGAYCASYCTRITRHHGLEDDQIFPHLRRSDAGLAPVIDRLAEEHVIIHEVVEGVDRALVELIRDDGDFTALQEAMDILSDTLLSHLAYEEQQLVEPLARFGFAPGQV